jgi:spore coat polysaccharide biosynthesis protein SpsF
MAAEKVIANERANPMILAILQARMSSSRLPGKVLTPILGIPMLQHQLQRLNQCKSIDKLVVATSTQSSDDLLASMCEQIGQACYRGDLNNVLKRFYDCTVKYGAEKYGAEQSQPTHIVRLTGDCPLIDSSVVDDVVNKHVQKKYDYTTNAYPQSFPDGLDVEVMTAQTLKTIYQKATQPEEFEHVTFYVRRYAQDFSIGTLTCDQDLSEQRWTVDYPEDFALAKAVFEGLYEKNPHFNYQQVLTFLQHHPNVFALNRQHSD